MNVDRGLQTESRWKRAILDEGPVMCQLPRGCVVFVLQEESILIGWGHKESDTTEQPANTHTHTHTCMHTHAHTQEPVPSWPISIPLMCRYVTAIFPDGL